jgi:hypothetical protein
VRVRTSQPTRRTPCRRSAAVSTESVQSRSCLPSRAR